MRTTYPNSSDGQVPWDKDILSESEILEVRDALIVFLRENPHCPARGYAYGALNWMWFVVDQKDLFERLLYLEFIRVFNDTSQVSRLLQCLNMETPHPPGNSLINSEALPVVENHYKESGEWLKFIEEETDWLEGRKTFEDILNGLRLGE